MIILDPLKKPEKLAKDFARRLDEIQSRDIALAVRKQSER